MHFYFFEMVPIYIGTLDFKKKILTYKVESYYSSLKIQLDKNLSFVFCKSTSNF